MARCAAESPAASSREQGAPRRASAHHGALSSPLRSMRMQSSEGLSCRVLSRPLPSNETCSISLPSCASSRRRISMSPLLSLHDRM
eukprot:6193019-Pleurochrysis_carterae.AAC.1